MATPILPEWFLQEPPSEHLSGGRPSPHARKALTSLGKALARELTGGEIPQSWLSRLDPRAKIVGVLVLIVCSTLIHGLMPLLGLLVFALALAFSARIGIGRLGRFWLGVPLFSLAIILPAILNIVTPGDPVLTLGHFAPGTKIGPWMLPESLSVTRDGLVVAARFLLRSVDAITFALLLVTTTDSAVLLNGLRRLGMPKAFGMVLVMTHRYLTVLLRTAEEIHLAKLSRTIGGGSVQREQRWVAAGIGMLFRKTHRLAQEVYSAMISRGYDGDIQVRQTPDLGKSDYLFVWGTVVLAVMTVVIDRLI